MTERLEFKVPVGLPGWWAVWLKTCLGEEEATQRGGGLVHHREPAGRQESCGNGRPPAAPPSAAGRLHSHCVH